MIDTTEYFMERERLRADMANQIARLSRDTSDRGHSVRAAYDVYMRNRPGRYGNPRVAWRSCYSMQRHKTAAQRKQIAAMFGNWASDIAKIFDHRNIDDLLAPMPNGASNHKVSIDPK